METASSSQTPGGMTNAVLKGRVFDRRRQFDVLDEEIRTTTEECAEYLTSEKDKVFQQQQSLLTKSVLGVRGKLLVDTILAWLKQKKGSEDASESEDEKMMDKAKQVAEALVLYGYLTPYKEHDKSPRKKSEGFVNDNELLVPVGKHVTELKSTSVWSVMEGAVFAGYLKRRHGLLGSFTQGKEVYVVANSTTKGIHFFESDMARGPLADLDAERVKVTRDASQFEFGVKLWKEDVMELLNAGSEETQNLLFDAAVQAGAKDRNAYHIDPSSVESFHELRDYNIEGEEVSMENYKGKVLLVVNVACDTPEADAHFRELTSLNKKYQDSGFRVLAFPSNQHEGTQFLTNEGMFDFIRPFGFDGKLFEKADVHGINIRPVFAYLKHMLSTPFHQNIKSNFVKFLVDHTGKPVKRYNTSDSPLSFENEIQRLIGAKADKVNDATEGNFLPDVESENQQEEQKTSDDKELLVKVENTAAPEVSDNQMEHQRHDVGDVLNIMMDDKNDQIRSVTKTMTKMEVTVTKAGGDKQQDETTTDGGNQDKMKTSSPEMTSDTAECVAP